MKRVPNSVYMFYEFPLSRRDFTASAPNRLWVTDLTMIATDGGLFRRLGRR